MKIGDILPKNLTKKEKKIIVDIFAEAIRKELRRKQMEESMKNLIRYSVTS